MITRIRSAILSIAIGFTSGLTLILLASFSPESSLLVKCAGLWGVPYYIKLVMLISCLLTLDYTLHAKENLWNE